MGSGTSTSIKRAAKAPLGQADRACWHDRASALYEELKGPATRLVRRAYGSTFGADEIEDIYSSAWLGTLRALERRQAELDDEEVRSYLLTAVANHAGKEIRRRRRKPVAPLEAAGSVAQTGATPEEIAATRETGAVTRDVLSSLPPRRRAVMLLRYGWGLEPAEVCGLVEGLSPRAYRKEVTRGVDEIAARIKLVESGEWCAEREPLLKAYASGLADEDQSLQAQRHISHCRSCAEFVGRLSGQLHELGSGLLLVPGALDAADGHLGILGKLKDTADSVRESALGVFGRTDAAEGMTLATGARGAGVGGAGLGAKLAGIGAGGKAALACVGGGLAATACIVAGVGPVRLGDSSEEIESLDRPGFTRADLVIERPRRPASARDGADRAPQAGGASGGSRASGSGDPEPAPSRAISQDTPPVTQEFGVESAATPVGAPPPQTSPGSGGGAVATEFGP